MKLGLRAVNPLLALSVFGGASSSNIAIELGINGPTIANANSCASGAIAIGEATRLIRDGAATIVLAGGAEAPLSPLAFGAFTLIRALSTNNDLPENACRPFDKDRDGFVMGEGGAILVLEELHHALKREAHIYAEVIGFGTTNDAYHMTSPLPDGAQATRAMQLALREANIQPEEIDYINAHGSSTPLNDSTETLAIKNALGPEAYGIPISGTKGLYGHALGASGAIEAAICALVFEHNYLPMTVNLREPDPDCDLSYLQGEGIERKVRTILSNSFGFGGINATLVFAHYPNRRGLKIITGRLDNLRRGSWSTRQA
jgi:3-oxoacyl-[acyl-carrier-protein] synthase II